MCLNNGKAESSPLNHLIPPDELVLNIKSDFKGRVWVLTNSSIYLIHLDLPMGYMGVHKGLSLGKVKKVFMSGGVLIAVMDKGLFSFNGEYLDPVSVGSLEFIEVQSIQIHGGGYLFDRYRRIMWTDGEELRELIGLPGEIMSFEIYGDILWVSLVDRLQAYRLDAEWGLTLLQDISSSIGTMKLGVDGTGRVWGWSPRAPLLEVEGDATGEIELLRHDHIAGSDLLSKDHRFMMTHDGPVLVFEDRLLRREPDDGNWQSIQVDSVRGLPEAMRFRSTDGNLIGWLIYRDEEFGCRVVKELSWRKDGDASWEILPWVDMDTLGRVTALEVVEGEQREYVIGGSKGILLAEASLPDEIPEPKAPVVTDHAGRLEVSDALESKFGELNYHFYFSSPESVLYYPVRYETRLRGLNEAWTAVGSSDSRELGQLLEGKYELEVRARDPFGRLSPATRVHIRVYPPWYRTVYAYVALIVGLIFLVLLAHRIRVRQMRKQQVYLAGIVQDRTAQLEKANDFKDDFIANLSHEIRNPLNGVIGLIQQLRPSEPVKERNLVALQGAANYLKTTVEEVLDFSKLQSGELLLEKASVDIRGVVDGVTEIYRGQAAKGVELTSDVRIPEQLGVVTDEAKVSQIIGNLTGNAIKFTRSGSVHVGVVLKPDTDGQGILRIWVEDTGPGIPASEQLKIFDKFYQSWGSEQKTRGTGLGLALVKRYADFLGGQVNLKSEPGRGSVFQVVFPVETTRFDATDFQSSEREAPTFSELSVLVVEDHEYNRIVLEGHLTELGCAVDFAEDGPSGLAMAIENRYDVVLLDWDLPGMKGLEVARNLRCDKRFPGGSRIIGMTAFATADVREKCLAAGMDDFMTKPLSVAQIRHLLAGISATPNFIEARGLLAEMKNGQTWEANLKRWASYYDEYRDELGNAIGSGDPEAVRKAAHRLLGHLKMLELRDIPDSLKDLLTVAQSADREGILTEWGSLSVKLDQFQQELARFRES